MNWRFSKPNTLSHENYYAVLHNEYSVLQLQESLEQLYPGIPLHQNSFAFLSPPAGTWQRGKYMKLGGQKFLC